MQQEDAKTRGRRWEQIGQQVLDLAAPRRYSLCVDL